MYKPGDFLELPNGRSVRLNKDTAEIANAAVAVVVDRVFGTCETIQGPDPATVSVLKGLFLGEGWGMAWANLKDEAPERLPARRQVPTKGFGLLRSGLG